MSRDKLVQATYFLLRFVSGLLFLEAGGSKLFGWFGILPPDKYPSGTVPIMTQAGIGGLMEFVGGVLILFGLFTRPVAFLLSGEMAVAYFQFHQSKGTWPIQNQGQQAVLFCFIFLFMAAFGAGQYSVDSWIRARRDKHAGTA